MFITSLPYGTICNKCADVFQKKCYTCFCFQHDAFVNLFILLCIHLNVFLFSIYLLNFCSCIFIFYEFLIASVFFIIIIAFLPCNSFEISTAVIIVVTFFLFEIPIISRKLECLCETSGCWVGESERMLFVLAAYGHFHWHEGTLTSNRHTIFVMHIESLLNCFNALSLWPVCVPLHLSFSHHKWNCTKSFTVLTHFDCSQSFIFLLTFIFIDPTLAKIVNYSPFIRVSRIRCLKKKCLYHNLNIKSALL